MLDHESQWLLRSAFIRGSFIPLTAPAMMVMEITEFHPYHISDVSHFYAVYFSWFSSCEHSLLIPHLQNTKLTHFVTLLGRVPPSTHVTVTAARREKTPKTQNSTQKQLLSKAPRQQPQTTMKHQGWGTEITLVQSQIHWLNNAQACCSLQTRTVLHPEHQPTAAIHCLPPALHTEVSIKKRFRLI